MSQLPLAAALDYAFRDHSLLPLALTHRSYSANNYERLEFLGDAVLNCVVAEYLIDTYQGVSEGDLSRLRARVVCGEALAAVARSIGLGQHLRLGDGEIKSGGRDRDSILADALEAVIGAVHRDGGFEAARTLVLRLFKPALAEVSIASDNKDAKTRLQEILQGRRLHLPVYELVATHGAAHDQTFDVVCRIESLAVKTQGSGSSRRAAEQAAATAALQAMNT